VVFVDIFAPKSTAWDDGSNKTLYEETTTRRRQRPAEEIEDAFTPQRQASFRQRNSRLAHRSLSGRLNTQFDHEPNNQIYQHDGM
jgi:hypothetical protein